MLQMDEKMQWKVFQWIVTGGLKREKYNLIMDTQQQLIHMRDL